MGFFFVAAIMLIQIFVPSRAVCFADGEEIFVMRLKSSTFFSKRTCSEVDHSKHISSKIN